ncbi:ubiquitin-like-specific protease ESD4 [Primulina huaijiensis]|uniref:ubiquitin-like-specific protease ESD4 n=1 Tax=Primulina huaijiensis TaxID=1492673 RepID=UPI003CC6EB5F
MGAFTSNRKRGEDFNKSLLSNSPSYDQSRAHIAKKLRLSASTSKNIHENYPPASPNSVRSRIALYPDPKSRGSREVHAPVRRSRIGAFFGAKKLGIAASSKESTAEKIDSFFVAEFEAKFSSARFFNGQNDVFVPRKKEKEVIRIKDDEEEDNLIDVSDDSGVEEVDVVDVLNGKWKEHRTPEQSPNYEIKSVEKELKSLDSSIASDVSKVNAKIDVVEKMDLILLDQEPDASRVHKKLYDASKKRDGKLQSLTFLIGFYEMCVRRFSFLRSHKKEEQFKDVASECFIPLTKEEEDDIDRALSNFYRRKVLVSHKNSNIDISGEILRCLSPEAWLNDEVINVYLELLKERESKDPQKFLKCHFFNTFFYKKLISGRGGYNFQSVRRWTTHKKLGYNLLECDKIFVPIHQEIHWCLAVINKKDEKFQYLDSLRGVDSQVLNVLARYYVDEVKEKCGKDLNVSSWEREYVTDLPKQENGFDCGVFMIKYADFFSRDIGLCFNQQHMPYFRRRIAKEILKLRAE